MKMRDNIQDDIAILLIVLPVTFLGLGYAVWMI